jgi:probable rRNA maturation factor
MEEDPQIEFYIDASNDEQNAIIEEALPASKAELVVKQTLQAAGIMQPVMLTLLITNDETMRDMNRQYRQQNKTTDVLSFPLLDKPLADAPKDQLWTPSEDQEAAQGAKAENMSAFVTPPELLINLGDIVVSWPTVLKQASAAGHSAIYELLYLISHGVLHLVGYDDQNEAGYLAMVQIQQSVLAAMG